MSRQLINISVGILSLFFWGTPPSYAYEQPSHAWIGEQAFELLRALPAEFPLPFPVPTPYGAFVSEAEEFIGSYTAFADPKKYEMQGHTGLGANSGSSIIEGIVEEDDLTFVIARPDLFDVDLRSTQHFWFPDHDLFTGYRHGLLAPGVPRTAVVKAQWLYDQAIRYYPTNKPLAYWTLGRVAHLLQDMASPAHVHVDDHIYPEGLDWLALRLLAGLLDYDKYSIHGDSYEHWVYDRNNHKRYGHSNVPRDLNNPIGLAFGLSSPRYKIPLGYNPNLVRLFYNMAVFARGFDSDDSGHFDFVLNSESYFTVPESTNNHGRYNSFFARVVFPRPFAGVPRLSWYRTTTCGGNTQINQWISGVLGTDYEYDDYSNLQVIYLYPHVQQCFNAGGSTEALRVEDEQGSTVFKELDTRTGGRRISAVPSSVLAREYLPQLEPRIIAYTAALYILFWIDTHPGVAAKFAVSCDGGGLDIFQAGTSSQAGGNGGTIDIRTGLNVSIGDGHLGDLRESRTLANNVYEFRQVPPDGAVTIEVVGDVTVYCQYVFAPLRIIGKTDAEGNGPKLTVFAGSGLFVKDGGRNPEIPVNFMGTGHGQPVGGNPGTIVNFDGELAATGRSAGTGGTFRFWTTQRGSIIGKFSAQGGWARSSEDEGSSVGEPGGNGGSVILMAPDSRISGDDGFYLIPGRLIDASGGYGAFLTEGDGGNGGMGGTVILKGDVTDSEDLDIYANGAEASAGSSPQSSHTQPPKDGRNAYNGGEGGAGGRVLLVSYENTTNVPSKPQIHLVYAVGGRGGFGGDGEPGANGFDVLNSNGQNGRNGGYGGSGGNAGSPGIVIGFPNGIVFTNIYSGGEGGSGGSGGDGGAGAALFRGGAGGNGGNGGDAGGDYLTPRDSAFGGRGGAAGTGGKNGDAYGGFAPSGSAGKRGSNGFVLSMPTIEAPKLPNVNLLANNPSFPVLEFSLQQNSIQGGAVLTLRKVSGDSFIEVEGSDDLVQWQTIFATFTSSPSISIRDAAATGRRTRFYRITNR